MAMRDTSGPYNPLTGSETQTPKGQSPMSAVQPARGRRAAAPRGGRPPLLRLRTFLLLVVAGVITGLGIREPIWWFAAGVFVMVLRALDRFVGK